MAFLFFGEIQLPEKYITFSIDSNFRLFNLFNHAEPTIYLGRIRTRLFENDAFDAKEYYSFIKFSFLNNSSEGELEMIFDSNFPEEKHYLDFFLNEYNMHFSLIKKYLKENCIYFHSLFNNEKVFVEQASVKKTLSDTIAIKILNDKNLYSFEYDKNSESILEIYSKIKSMEEKYEEVGVPEIYFSHKSFKKSITSVHEMKLLFSERTFETEGSINGQVDFPSKDLPYFLKLKILTV